MGDWYHAGGGVYKHTKLPVHSYQDSSGRVRYVHSETDRELPSPWDYETSPIESRTLDAAALQVQVTAMQTKLDALQAAAIGVPVPWPVDTAPPPDYILAHGQALNETLFPELFSVYGYTYGNPSAGFFSNIDLRGEFVRARDAGAGRDPDAASRTDRGDGTVGDAVGTRQLDAIKSHSHTFSYLGSTSPFSSGNVGIWPATTITANTSSFGGSESRPRNVALDFIVRYK